MFDVSANLRAFFRERLTASLEQRSFEVQRDTEFYVVDLMVRFANCSAEESLDRPFVERLAKAVEAKGDARLRHFKALGDAALCACGFFSDYLDNRGIERAYVEAMGHRGYNAASTLAARTPHAATYHELADAFSGLAAALDDVRETTELRTPQDIVRLYDRWRATGSPRVAERLRSEGVFPVEGDLDTLH